MSTNQSTTVHSSTTSAVEPSKNDIASATRTLHRRFLSAYFLRGLLLSISLYLILVGLVTLTVRSINYQPGINALAYSWIGGLLIAGGAFYYAMAKAGALRGRLAELIDAHGELGGQLMVAQATGTNASQLTIQDDQIPTVNYRAQPHILLLGLASLFIVAAFLFPVDDFAGGNNGIELDTTVAKYEKQIEVLETEKVITPELAEQLETQLNQISEKASSVDPADTWQALDQLSERIAEEAALAAQEMVESGDKLSEIEEGLENQAAGTANSQLEEMQELNELLNQQMANNSAFQDAAAADPELMKLLKALEKQLAELEKQQTTQTKLFANENLSEEDRKKVDDLLKELGLNNDEAKPEELSDEQMAQLQELANEESGKSVEELLKELSEKLADKKLAESKPLELTQEQLDQLKQKLEEMGISPDDFAVLEDQESGLSDASATSSSIDTVISQIFLNFEIDPTGLTDADKAVEELKIPEKQYAKVPLDILDGMRDVLSDGKITKEEIDALRPEIDTFLHSPNDLPPVENEDLEKLEQKLKDAGIAEEDYLLIKSGECNCEGGGQSSGSGEELIGLAQKMKAMRQAMIEKLKRMQQAGALSDKLAKQCQGALSGRGGISRGGGASDMTFNQNKSESKDKKFQSEILPLNRVNMKQSELLAVQKGDAKNLQAEKADQTNALKSKKSVGETTKNTILPEHRKYLEKYRKQNQSGGE